MSDKPAKQLSSVRNAEAALFFVEGQYLLKWIEGGVEYGKYLSPASARAAFAKEPIDSGWLPSGVLRCGNGSRGAWMLKWFEPAIYRMTIDVAAKEEKAKRKVKALRSIRVPMPSLIWFGQKSHYYIFAAKESKFKSDAILYRAPLPNVDSHGLICFGQNTHMDVAKGGFDKTWKTFWEAPFSDHHDNGKSNSEKDHVLTALSSLAKARATKYPLGDLVKANTTLESVIAQLTRRSEAQPYYFDDDYGDDIDE